MTIVYIVTNQAMPGIIKIGRTADPIENRIRTLDNTSVPLPFECFYAAEVPDSVGLERALLQAFEDHRVRSSREFFRLSPDKPKVIIQLLAIREVTPRRDVISEAGDQIALDQARIRRSNFRFSMIGIRPGSILVSVFNEKMTCIVKGDRSIIFREEETSLSKSALIIAREIGYEWTAVSGPTCWKFDGKTLDELREEAANVSDEQVEPGQN